MCSNLRKYLAAYFEVTFGYFYSEKLILVQTVSFANMWLKVKTDKTCQCMYKLVQIYDTF